MIKVIKIIIFITVVAVILSVSSVSAQSVLPLTVGPARQQITINPGEQASFTVRFYNESETPITGLLKVNDFIVQDKDGSPRILDDVSQGTSRFTGSSWITLPYDRMSIAANDKVTVQATLSVPNDARPGGRYVSVYFEPSTALPQAVDNTVGQGVSPRIASLIYIRVAGPITENAMISNLFAKSFFEYGPIDVTSEILNQGDYHIRPRGILSLSDMLGGLIEQSPLKEENIFPDAAREYTNKLGSKWMFGQYKINLVASYGEQGKALERSISVWVFPWKVVTMIILTVIIVILFVRTMYTKLVVKESKLEQEVEKEREEIEKLKGELKKRKE